MIRNYFKAGIINFIYGGSMKAFEMEAKKELCCIQLVNDLPVLRARLGVSQEEVAEKIGVSRQTYNSYESKKRKIPWNICIVLVSYFVSNSKTLEMIKGNTYTLELMEEIFNSNFPHQ